MVAATRVREDNMSLRRAPHNPVRLDTLVNTAVGIVRIL